MTLPKIVIELVDKKFETLYSDSELSFILVDRAGCSEQVTISGPHEPILEKANLSKVIEGVAILRDVLDRQDKPVDTLQTNSFGESGPSSAQTQPLTIVIQLIDNKFIGLYSNIDLTFYVIKQPLSETSINLSGPYAPAAATPELTNAVDGALILKSIVKTTNKKSVSAPTEPKE